MSLNYTLSQSHVLKLLNPFTKLPFGTNASQILHGQCCNTLFPLSILALYLTDEMFSIGSFISYGSEWATSLPVGDNETTLIKDKLFPKMVACEIKRWGPSGMY